MVGKRNTRISLLLVRQLFTLVHDLANATCKTDFIVSAVVFTGKFYNSFSQTSDSFTKWAICVMVDRCHLQRYMQLHNVYEDNLLQLGSILQRQLVSVRTCTSRLASNRGTDIRSLLFFSEIA